MDYTKKDTLYEQAKLSLKKFKGDGPSCAGSGSAKTQPSIKLEPAFLAEHEEALVAAGYFHKSRFAQRGKWRPGRGRGSDMMDRGYSHNTKVTRPINPKGPDGNSLTCLCCGSYRHMLTDCPHSWENLSKSAGESRTRALHWRDRAILGYESRNCAVLDSVWRTMDEVFSGLFG